MPPQPPVGLAPQSGRPGLGEMRFGVDQPDHAVRPHAAPCAVHEAAVEIGLSPNEQRPIHAGYPGARSWQPAAARSSRYRPSSSSSTCSRRSRTVATEGLSASPNHASSSASTRLSSQSGRTHGGLPTCRSNPPRGEDRGEVQLPVEEALPLGDPLADLQPRVRSQHVGDRLHLPEHDLVVLGVVQLGPGVSAPHIPRPRLASPCDTVPSSASSAPIHSSRVGGATDVVTGQNHNAAHASITRRRRR